ncbi:MAG: RNA polymerase sigma factor [Planctomycetota bacterium]
MRAISGECLVRDYFGRVHGYVRLRVSESDCEDVVAEVFLRALERRGQLRSADPGPWLLTVARSRVAEYHRRRRVASGRPAEETRRGRTASDSHSEAERREGTDMVRAAPASRTQPTPLEEVERKEFLSLLRQKMVVLSETERDVIALKFTEGLGNGEIAALLGVTANRLGVMLHRALGRLRAAMLEEAGDGVP